MSVKSGTGEVVRKTARELPTPTDANLERLRKAMQGPVDTTDIPERNLRGRRDGFIRTAVVGEMRRQGLSGHALWKAAKAHCDRLPESAVYQFLSGKRAVGVEYADALLKALGLEIVPGKRAG